MKKNDEVEKRRVGKMDEKWEKNYQNTVFIYLTATNILMIHISLFTRNSFSTHPTYIFFLKKD